MADGETQDGNPEEMNELTTKISTLISSQKWEEEDNGDDVKDNWDDEDEEPVKPEPKKAPATQSISTRNKKANKLAANSNDGNNINTKQLTPQEQREKRLQEEKLQRESDLKLTKQMLGMEDKDIALEFPLNTKEDFHLFHKNIVTKLWCYEKSPHYFLLLDRLFRDLCVPLDSEEVKSLSSTLNALFNEKVKAQKATTKPKKKGTKGYALKMERNPGADFDNNDYVDELDDIM